MGTNFHSRVMLVRTSETLRGFSSTTSTVIGSVYENKMQECQYFYISILGDKKKKERQKRTCLFYVCDRPIFSILGVSFFFFFFNFAKILNNQPILDKTLKFTEY